MNRKSFLGLVILIVFFAGVFAAVMAFRQGNDKILRTVSLPAGSTFEQFDPIANAEAARQSVTASTQLVSLHVEGFKSDGTVNLNAGTTPAPTVTYSFFEPGTFGPASTYGSSSGTTAGRTVTVSAVNDHQIRFVTSQSGFIRRSFRVRNKGLLISYGGNKQVQATDIVALPACSSQQLWSAILGTGISPQEVASLEYNADDAYTFTFPHLAKQVKLGFDCKVVTSAP